MGIELVHDLKTIRTNPRIMKHKTDAGTVIMTLHDHEATSGLVYLNGPNAGTIVKGGDINWEAFDDLRGSVTLWNRD
jgi:hypothetical protein